MCGGGGCSGFRERRGADIDFPPRIRGRKERKGSLKARAEEDEEEPFSSSCGPQERRNAHQD